jgi:hypothetical protein
MLAGFSESVFQNPVVFTFSESGLFFSFFLFFVLTCCKLGALDFIILGNTPSQCSCYQARDSDSARRQISPLPPLTAPNHATPSPAVCRSVQWATVADGCV